MARRKRRRRRRPEEQEEIRQRQPQADRSLQQPFAANPLTALAETPAFAQNRGLRQDAARQAQRRHGNAVVARRLQGTVQRADIEVGGKKYASREEVAADFYNMYAPQAIALDVEAFQGQPGLHAQIPDFMADYNFWTIPVSRWMMAVGRIQALQAQTGYSPNPDALSADERAAFEAAAPKVSTAWNEVEAAEEAATAYREVKAGFHKLRAAQSTLRATKQELVAKKIRLEKLPEKEAELQQIKDTIAKINEVIGTLEKIVAATAAVVAGGGAGAVKDVAGTGVASTLLGGLVNAAYAEEMNALKRDIDDLKAKAKAADLSAVQSRFAAAGEKLEEAQEQLKANVAKMESAIAQKRAAYTLAGAKMDEKKAAGGPTVKLEGIGQMEGMMMMASAVREAATFGNLQLEAMGSPGILGVINYQNENGYLLQTVYVNASHKALLNAVHQLKSFAGVSKKYLPDYLLWAEGWQKLMASSQNIAQDKSY